DLFAGIEGYEFGASVYLTSNGVTDVVRSESVTPNLFSLLGVTPRWGRMLQPQDAAAGAPAVVLIGEALARRLFGDPAQAVDRTFFTGKETLRVAGVMPASFRFPTAREEIWRPLDLTTWPDNHGLRDILRLAPGQTIATAEKIVDARSTAVA